MTDRKADFIENEKSYNKRNIKIYGIIFNAIFFIDAQKMVYNIKKKNLI